MGGVLRWTPLLLALTVLVVVCADVYNSAHQLAAVVKLERRLVQLLTQLNKEAPDQLIQRYLNDSHPIETHGGNIVNPVDTYHLLRRLTVDLREVTDALLPPDNGTNGWIQNIKTLLEDPSFPKEADLNEAAFALIRLQSIYGLSAEDLQQGHIRGHRSPWRLTDTDCLRLSQQGFSHMEFDLAELWNRVAGGLTNDTEASDKLDQKLAQIRLTKSMVKGLAQEQPAKFLGAFAGSGIPLSFLGEVMEKGQPGDGETMRRVEERYRRLCRGETVHPPSLTSRFYCSYTRSGESYRRLLPLKTELLWPDPLVVQYHDVTSARQRRRLVRLASPRLVTAQVTARIGDRSKPTQGRVSKMAFLSRDLSPLVDEFHRLVEAYTALSTASAEDLQVVNYGVGGHYEPHVDYYGSYELGVFSPPRDRVATFLFYLNQVEAGGATVFPFLGVAAWPSPGSALFWYNLRRSGRPEHSTVHASCPVLLGSKTIGNFWLHEDGQEFRRPCGRLDDD